MWGTLGNTFQVQGRISSHLFLFRHLHLTFHPSGNPKHLTTLISPPPSFSTHTPPCKSGEAERKRLAQDHQASFHGGMAVTTTPHKLSHFGKESISLPSCPDTKLLRTDLLPVSTLFHFPDYRVSTLIFICRDFSFLHLLQCSKGNLSHIYPGTTPSLSGRAPHFARASVLPLNM